MILAAFAFVAGLIAGPFFWSFILTKVIGDL